MGGLGKVIGIVMNFLPEDIGLCIPTYSDLEYSPDIEDSDAIMVQVRPVLTGGGVVLCVAPHRAAGRWPLTLHAAELHNTLPPT